MKRRLWILCAALAVSTTQVSAETAQRIRGTVASLDGYALRVVDDGRGHVVAVRLAPDYGVSGLVSAKPEEVVPGRYVGALAERHANDLLTARELHIFPDNLRGAGAGQNPSDAGSNDTVVAGTVDQGRIDALGGTVTLTYRGGESVVEVPPGTPLVRFVPGRRAMLVPGVHVVIAPDVAPGGGLTADHVIVGVDGLVPPM